MAQKAQALADFDSAEDDAARDGPDFSREESAELTVKEPAQEEPSLDWLRPNLSDEAFAAMCPPPSPRLVVAAPAIARPRRPIPKPDDYRQRLLGLRSRIIFAWPPEPSRGEKLLHRGGLSRKSTERLQVLLLAFPTPLPLEVGGKPDFIMRPKGTDLRAAIDRVVDAAFVLLGQEDLLSPYEGYVTVMGTGRPEEVGIKTLVKPPVFEVVSLIIEGLEAVIQCLDNN
jgi:hypothetical protein